MQSVISGVWPTPCGVLARTPVPTPFFPFKNLSGGGWMGWGWGMGMGDGDGVGVGVGCRV